MKPGRPKNDPMAPPKRARPESHLSDLVQPGSAAGKSRANNAPRQSPKSSFLGLLLADDRLTPADKKAIKSAAANGITAADVSALVAYELRMAHQFFLKKELSSKDLIVALNKISSQAAAAVQLGRPEGGGGLTRLEVSFVDSLPARTGESAIIGDPLDTE